MNVNLEVANGRQRVILLQKHFLTGSFKLDNGKRFCIRHDTLEYKSKDKDAQRPLVLMFNDILLICNPKKQESGGFKYSPKQYFWMKHLEVSCQFDEEKLDIYLFCEYSKRHATISYTNIVIAEYWFEDFEKYIEIAQTLQNNNANKT